MKTRNLFYRVVTVVALLAVLLPQGGSLPATAQGTGNTERVSVASDGTQGDGGSYRPSISADGRYVAFESVSGNLVNGDTNGENDVFVHDRQTGQTTRVSVASDGTQGNDGSNSISISADGRYVAFRSHASNLVSGDTNGTGDVFVHDRQTGQTTRVSVASDGTQGNGLSSYNSSPSISADGRYVAFNSEASNLVSGDTNGTTDVFLHDRQTGQTTRVSVASDGTQGNSPAYRPSISADGRYVAFESYASNLVSGDTNSTWDVFVHVQQTGQTLRVSVASDGTQGSGLSFYPSFSADGRYVAFISEASNLVSGDTNGTRDIFVHGQTGQTTRVSVASEGAEGNGVSEVPSISADGRYVAFVSNASNLVSGDTNSIWDVFVHDRQTGQTIRVSVASDGTQGNGSSILPSISADGRYVAFESDASNLVSGDTNGYTDVFVHDWGGGLDNDPPSITSATLEHGPGLPTNGRSSNLYVRVADPNGLSDIDSVVVDLSPIGGTTESLSEGWCTHPENGLYCDRYMVHTYGDIETGDKTLTITVTDKGGLTASYDLEVKVIMLMYDILQALGQDPDSILGQEVWIAALPAESFDPDVLTAGTEFVETVHQLMAPSLLGLMEAIALKLATSWTHAQLFLSIHYHEYINVLLVSWKPTWSGADFLPLGIPHYLKVRVRHSDLWDFDYLQVLDSQEDTPSPTHPYYSLPTGYTYYDYRDVALSPVPYGAKACTMGVITERYRLPSDWPSHAFLRLQLQAGDVPFVARILASERAPNLGDLALVCGTKQQESTPVYESDELGLLYDNLDTTQGSGSVIPIRSVSTSIVYGHEFLGDSTMAAALECPADLHIYDAQGRHTGPVYDAGGNVIRIDREIPNTTYLYGAGDTREMALVSNAVSSPYTITVQGTGAGTYTGTITIRNRQGSRTYYRSDAAIPTASGQTDTVLVAEIPAAPTGLELEVNGSTINLDWDDNTESDLEGYNVYRSTQADGVYQKMNDSLLPGSSFTDISADGNTTYYYYVTAEDTDHNESGHLAPVGSRQPVYLPIILKSH
jgi:Tol biopolymer transport system component